MAVSAKAKYLGSVAAQRKKVAPTGEKPTKGSPDFFVLTLLLLLMAAIMALAMWAASLGGGAAQPMDYWMLTP